ncbi:MAG: polyprenyl synthetase family protein [Rhodoferax sp.]
MHAPPTPPTLQVRLRIVQSAMQEAVSRHLPAGPYRALSDRLVAGVARQADLAATRLGWMPFIDLPFDVTAAAGGDPALSVPLSAASAFVFGGLDVLDDLADGDCQPQWEGVAPAQQTLVGVSSVLSFAQGLVADLPLPAHTVVAMLALLAQRMLLAGAGQQLDLALVGAEHPDPDLVLASVSGKSGEQLALYCEWAALAAGAGAEVVAAWGDYGRALGVAAQIKSDLSEVCHDEWCRDLASGNRTLPIAYHLHRAGAGRGGFIELLAQARTDLQAQHEVRRRLLDSGAIRMAALVAQMYVERGRSALQRAGSREPGHSRLVALLDGPEPPARNEATPNPRATPAAATRLGDEAPFTQQERKKA